MRALVKVEASSSRDERTRAICGGIALAACYAATYFVDRVRAFGDGGS